MTSQAVNRQECAGGRRAGLISLCLIWSFAFGPPINAQDVEEVLKSDLASARPTDLRDVEEAQKPYPAFVPTLETRDLEETLKPFAVHVVRVPKENWTGEGVYLGRGLVLTAGHVAGAFIHTVHVQTAGLDLPTQVLKRGWYSPTDDSATDLALLSIDDTELPAQHQAASHASMRGATRPRRRSRRCDPRTLRHFQCHIAHANPAWPCTEVSVVDGVCAPYGEIPALGSSTPKSNVCSASLAPKSRFTGASRKKGRFSCRTSI